MISDVKITLIKFVRGKKYVFNQSKEITFYMFKLEYLLRVY